MTTTTTTTTTTTRHHRGAVRLAVAATSVLLLTACGHGGTSSATNPEPGSSGTDALTPDLGKLCSQVTSRTVDGAAGSDLVVVQDGTGSVVSTPTPGAFAEQVTQTSRDDGGITVIGVNGAVTKPSTVLLDAALSTPGPRDRPSVAKLAVLMPACVDEAFRAPVTSTGSGTDLYRAMAAAAEVSTARTQLWTFSDMLSTAGELALTPELLGQEPDAAARAAVAAAPLDLHGATWHVVGIANTTTDVIPAQRSWLLAFTQGLCRGWDAAGCEKIALLATTATEAARPSAPADPAPAFPGVTTASTPTSCTFRLPSSIGFLSDSAVLLPGAERLIDGPLALLMAHSEAQATVVGHTASTDLATEGHSGQQLSLDRAKAVASVLEKVAPGRVTPSGVGDSQPLGADLDPATGAQIESVAARERRVEITVTGSACD